MLGPSAPYPNGIDVATRDEVFTLRRHNRLGVQPVELGCRR